MQRKKARNSAKPASWRFNAGIPGFFHQGLDLSTRGYHGVLEMARTIIDLVLELMLG